MGRDQQVQGAELFEQPARPALPGQLAGQGAEHPGHPGRLGVDHPGGHPVQWTVAAVAEVGDPGADLVTQPLVELVQTGRHPLGAGRGARFDHGAHPSSGD